MAKSDENITGVYKPRKPRETDFYSCVENHFEELKAIWDDLYASRYGFWRPYISDVIYRYLDCGDLRCGFARVRCDNCGHEYLSCLFRANAAIFAPRATKSGSSNTAIGF